MPLYLGSKTVSENINMGDTVIQNTFDLFDVKWSDHTINNESWMCADDFNWIDGTVFSAAWNELKSEWDLATIDSTPPETETIGTVTISYWRSPKGYKLVNYGGNTPEEREQWLEQLYAETGIAWYYLIDTTGQIRFKLPRTKYGFVGVRSGAGNFVDESLPNITGTAATDGFTINNLEPTGVFYNAEMTYSGRASETQTQPNGLGFDASLSSSVYQNGANVQQKSTEMHLYFYLADFVRTPLESNLNTFITETKEALNEKVNVSDYSADKTTIENDINTLETTKITQTDLEDTINTQRTNCITKIPQDIKLELSADGVLTLKAGSKVYFGDGSSIIIQQDIVPSISITSADSYELFLTRSGRYLTYNRILSQTGSGTTTPTEGYWAYYNTNDKKVYDINNGANEGELSLPIAIFTSDTSKIISIDQVFNGFGYIGSHWYEIKGTEGTARNGRNTDGSLNNSTRTTANVSIHACGGGTGNWFMLSGFDGNFRNANKIAYFIQDEMPSASSYSGNYAVWESPRENIIRFTSNKGVTWTKVLQINCGEYSTVDSRIISFNPKTVFQATDYYDFKQLDDSAAKLDENNTFTGVNVFENNSPVIVGRNTKDLSNADGMGLQLSAQDKNGTVWSYIDLFRRGGSNTSEAWMYSRNKSGVVCQIGATINDNGTYATYAPTPLASDNSTQIATTAWVKGRHQVVSVLPANPDPNTFYYIPEE